MPPIHEYMDGCLYDHMGQNPMPRGLKAIHIMGCPASKTDNARRPQLESLEATDHVHIGKTKGWCL